jgi:tripartite-type tricarboxylate transporter receptor subunit TctC
MFKKGGSYMKGCGLASKCFVAGLMLFAGLVPLVHAQDASRYPTRPINFIIPVSPGGSTDLYFRLLCREAEKTLGQPLVILNKPGLVQGTSAIAVAKPDGYTIGQSSNSAMLLIPHLEKVPYNTIKDFKYIVQTASVNFGVFIKGDSPFKTFKDIIAYARQNPKKVTFGGPVNSIHYYITEQIARKERVQFTHIPFKGGPEVANAVLGGHVLFGVGDFNYSLVEAGEIRLLLLFREEKAEEYPHTPVLKDLGYDIPAPYYFGICGPAGLPDAIVKRLEDAFTRAMKEPNVINGVKDLRIPTVYRDSKALDEYIRVNYEKFGKIVKETQAN